METLTLPKFNDLHVHFRQGPEIRVSSFSAPYCEHVLVMPNTTPPIREWTDAAVYRRVISEAPGGFKPAQLLMTIKLLDETTPNTIENACNEGVTAAKLYPRGVTTNSDDGVTDIRVLYPVFETMQARDMVLCLHGEHPAPHEFCTVMDWEREFINRIFLPLIDNFPKLRVVLEHITTGYAVGTVAAARKGVAATITPHHLFLTLDDICGRKLNPRNFCMPIAKTPRDRAALQSVVLAGDHKFFLGSDSAPHDKSRKHCEEGCAGVFTAPIVPELLVEFFERHAQLSTPAGKRSLIRFARTNGAEFYRLPLIPYVEEIVLHRARWCVPAIYQVPDKQQSYYYVPFWAGEQLNWQRESLRDSHVAA